MPTHVCVCARVWIRKLVAAEVEFSKFKFFNAFVSLIPHLQSTIFSSPLYPLSPPYFALHKIASNW